MLFVFTCGFQSSLRYFLLEHSVTFEILDTEPLIGEECLDHSIPHLITFIRRNNKSRFYQIDLTSLETFMVSQSNIYTCEYKFYKKNPTVTSKTFVIILISNRLQKFFSLDYSLKTIGNFYSSFFKLSKFRNKFSLLT